MTIVHIQQGGSSREMYLHLHGTQEEADACRKSCEGGAYNVGPDRKTRVKLTSASICLIEELISDAADLV